MTALSLHAGYLALVSLVCLPVQPEQASAPIGTGQAGGRAKAGNSGDWATRAEAAMRGGRLDSAEAAYERAVVAQSGSAELWSNLGTVRVMRGKCVSALRALARARQLNPELYTPWYFAGFCRLQLHQEKAALADLERAVELNPRDANAWYVRSRAAANLGRLDIAFDSALQGLAVDPARPDLYTQAGRVSLDLATECYRRTAAAPDGEAFVFRLEGERDAAQGLPELAVEAYKKAARRAPNDTDIPFALALLYLDLGKLAEAESQCRLALAAAPGSSWAQLSLAMVLRREGKSAEAAQLAAGLDPSGFECREEFEDFLSLAAKLKDSQLGERALAWGLAQFPGDRRLAAWTEPRAFATGPPETAMDSAGPRGADKTCLSVRFLVMANRELRRAPAGAGALARVFPSTEEYARFRKAFLRDDFSMVAKLIAPKLQALPQDAEGAFVLGQILHWLSFEYDERLQSSFPDSEAAQILTAENLAETNQAERAIASFQALIAKDGDSPDLLRSLARVYWTEHQWDEALEVLRRVLKADPGDATTMVNMGRIYSYRQDLKNARLSFSQAVEADPKSFGAHLGLGETSRREGSAAAALRELKIAERLDPNNPRPHYILAQLYRRLGEQPSADREMAKFQRLQFQMAAAKTRKTEELVPVD